MCALRLDLDLALEDAHELAKVGVHWHRLLSIHHHVELLGRGREVLLLLLLLLLLVRSQHHITKNREQERVQEREFKRERVQERERESSRERERESKRERGQEREKKV